VDERPAPPDDDSEDRNGEDRNPETPPAKIQPAKERVGERPDNLRRRQSWFRKRTADSD
jgi:hypothetical protein